MIDQEDKINPSKNDFDDNNQERKRWACLEQIFNSVFVPTFCDFVD